MVDKNINTNQLAEATLQFLDRTELKGAEALTFLACKQWLTKLAQKPTVVPDEASDKETEVG